jgi:hypothetical protein
LGSHCVARVSLVIATLEALRNPTDDNAKIKIIETTKISKFNDKETLQIIDNQIINKMLGYDANKDFSYRHKCLLCVYTQPTIKLKNIYP